MAVRTWLGGALACFFAFSALAADQGKELILAARLGETAKVAALAASPAAREFKDSKGRTPLMIAAMYGNPEAMKALLAKGARLDARDKEGLTAYGVALFYSSGKKKEVMALLPKPAATAVRVDSAWLADNVSGSCFLSPKELGQMVAALHPDGMVLREFAEYLHTEGMGVVDLDSADANGLKTAAGTATSATQPAITLDVRPGVSCDRGADRLSLAIDVRVTVPGRPAPVFQKTFGGGLRGLGTQSVTTPTQYDAIFAKWAKAHADSIYWGVARALLAQPK
jgi:hypothetical protein